MSPSDPLHRRAVLAFAAGLSLAATSAARAGGDPARAVTPDASMPLPPGARPAIAMLVYPGLTALDLVGPHTMFAAVAGARIHLVAKSLDPVTSDTGLVIAPTTTFAACPRDLTILFAPGGTDGTLAAASDPVTLAFMADRGASARYVNSVCTGSLVLGAAGLLAGYRATSHWSVRDLLAGFGAIPTDARVVRDRNRVTGAGVTAGLDLGLTMVAELCGRTEAECCQLMNEYDPAPPFDAGSPRTASAAVQASTAQRLAPFVDGAKRLAGGG